MSDAADEGFAQIRQGVEGAVAIAELPSRVEVTIAGEITSIVVVPQPQGSPRLEAIISDGSGAVVAIWLGRSRIAGVLPGRRLSICAAAAPRRPGGPPVFYNPQYELLRKDC